MKNHFKFITSYHLCHSTICQREKDKPFLFNIELEGKFQIVELSTIIVHIGTENEYEVEKVHWKTQEHSGYLIFNVEILKVKEKMVSLHYISCITI